MCVCGDATNYTCWLCVLALAGYVSVVMWWTARQLCVLAGCVSVAMWWTTHVDCVYLQAVCLWWCHELHISCTCRLCVCGSAMNYTCQLCVLAGCEPCDCDRVGSTNYTCVERGGQCQCKPGVTGRRCDTCQRFFFGFSQTGCQGESCVTCLWMLTPPFTPSSW